MKAVNEQFKKLNARLDDLQSPSTFKSTRRRVVKEEEEYDLYYEESSFRKSKNIV